LFLAPAFALFLVFLVYPIFRSLYYSLFNWNGLGPAVDFVGLDNFRQIVTDKIFLTAVGNGILIVVLSLAIQLPFSLALSIMVGRDLPGRAFFAPSFSCLTYFPRSSLPLLDGPFQPRLESGSNQCPLILIQGFNLKLPK